MRRSLNERMNNEATTGWHGKVRSIIGKNFFIQSVRDDALELEMFVMEWR